MTITIVGVFVFCWTPYNVMSIWHLSDPESAQHLDQKIQKGLFIFAVANSSFNPIVYGIFSRRRTRKARKLQRCKVPYEIKTQQSFKRGLHLTKSEYDGNDIELKAVIHKENGTCYTSIKRLNAPASAIPT